MLDCAACYQNEKEIGVEIAAFLKNSDVERKELFIMSKVWNDRYRDVEKACRESIADLQCGASHRRTASIRPLSL